MQSLASQQSQTIITHFKPLYNVQFVGVVVRNDPTGTISLSNTLLYITTTFQTPNFPKHHQSQRLTERLFICSKKVLLNICALKIKVVPLGKFLTKQT